MASFWTYELTYNQKKIKNTDKLFNIREIRIKDSLEGKADEIEITITDPDPKWFGSWYPQKGDEISGWIDYAGTQINIGTYFLDEWPMSKGPAEIKLKGLSFEATKDANWRKKKTETFENIELQTLVTGIAQRHGWKTIFGGDSYVLSRVVQKNETDLAFLKKLASQNGFFCKTTNKTVIFQALEYDTYTPVRSGNTLEVTEGTTSKYIDVDPTDMVQGSFKITTKGDYPDRAAVKYFSPFDAKFERILVQNGAKDGIDQGDVITRNRTNSVFGTARNIGLEAQLSRVVLGFQTSPAMHSKAHKMWAGSILALGECDVLNGAYLIYEAEHSITSEGWQVTIEEAKRLTSQSIYPQKPLTTAELAALRKKQAADYYKDLIDASSIDAQIRRVTGQYGSSIATQQNPPAQPEISGPRPAPSGRSLTAERN